MPCFHPQTAYLPLDGGRLSFHEVKDSRTIQVPCRQCIGCRTKRRDEVATRIVCESKMHENVWFPTLTYADEHLPSNGSLDHRDVQLFLKRTRKELGPLRYVCTGEYGDSFGRPHYHLVTFGLDIPDLQKCNSTYAKDVIFKSDVLERLWGKGGVRIAPVNFAVARYVATYCVKRVTGGKAESHYAAVDSSTGECVQLRPEYGVWSKGLGVSFFRKYWPEIVASGHDGIYLDGAKRPVPRAFRERLSLVGVPTDVIDALEYRDFQRLVKSEGDRTPERLAVRERCAEAQARFYANG